MAISRRVWFGRMVQGLLGTALGETLRSRLAVQAAGLDAGRHREGPLITRVTRPFDAETPVRELVAYLTPNHRFFVRSHFGPPMLESIAEATWTLRVAGAVDKPQTIALDDLRRMQPATVTAVLQCSGNGRAFHHPKVTGVQWERGAVGNAEWTGVRLRDLLTEAGVDPRARHVQFLGADRPPLSSVPLFLRSIPLAKALHPDTLVAYEMNGRPLPVLHGAPLRVITPGWMADSWTKWLTHITVQEEEAEGYYMQTAYRMPLRPLEPGASPGGEAMTPVEAMTVKSLICSPGEGDTIPIGPVTIQGVAWSGEERPVKVEVSMDDGLTWNSARFVGDDRPYAWRQWQYVWKASTAGTFPVRCRATDEMGAMQPAVTAWNPGGFMWNGWDRVMVTVVSNSGMRSAR
ncbi:putative Sulfite:cytochrome c oxidoreductase, subunit A [Nitrospira sp. KM1]|nr:putative Sulfite:cytochrome c oxidoreductase, subunit A [Nitrospira sp. KM1]